jgi:ribosomal protein S18 acetylase RimI-like enzyme
MKANAQEIVVKSALAEHAEEIAKVQRETWLAAYPSEAAGITHAMIEERVKTYESLERIARWREIIASGELVSVALIGGRVIGFSSGKRGDDVNHLAAIYVLPAYHGTGTAQKLMDAALAWLGNDKDIVIEVVAYNDRAIRFYEKYGFVATGESGDHDLMPTILMRRAA